MADQDADEARKRMQVKSFTTWINLHLGKVGLQVDDLKTDFSDGIKLLKLVEVISEESLGKYNKKCMSKFQKVENLNIPLKYINGFIKDQGISNQYSAENILEENEMLILGMVWSLILRFAVQEISEGDRTAKEGLLLWAQKKVEDGSRGKVQVTNFHTSWQDGTAFCSLIQAFRPDLIDSKAVRKSEDKAVQQANLKLAFDTASDALGIPKMLDPVDMTSHRPDEKSVMTYVSFFWKEFASNKKKAMAAERISKVVAREVHYVELQAQYAERASALASWLQETKASFATLPPVNDVGMLQETLDKYVEYSRTIRPAKISELMEVEALYASISSRLAALGGRTYAAPEACALASLQRWWEELTMAEQKYEEAIKTSLGGVKRVGALIKIFNSKAAKLDGWLATKAAWVQANHEPCFVQLGKPIEPPAPVASLSFSSADPDGGQPDGVTGEEEFERLRDPTLQTSADELSPSKAIRGRAVSMPPAATSAGASSGDATPATPANAKDDTEVQQASRPRQQSFFGDLFAAIQDHFEPSAEGKDEKGADGADGAVKLETSRSLEGPTTPSRSSGQVLKTRRSLLTFSKELREQKLRQTEEGPLDTTAAVLARLNLLKAYEEEQSSRQLSLANLNKLYEQLASFACPNLETYAQRRDDLTASLAALAEAAAAYRADLELVLKAHQELDDKRLSFAKRAEALNRWIEESTDAMSEAFSIESMREADAIEAELKAFRDEYGANQAECDALIALGTELGAAGPNPYTRFRTADLSSALSGAVDAAEERTTRLAAERDKIAAIDSTKREFAQAAEVVIAFLKSEKASLESATPPSTIHPDDADSIAKGKGTLAYLETYASKAAERAEIFVDVKRLADALMAEAETDNPYTRESVSSLQSLADQLEKLVRDKQSFVEGQLARATADITPEQHRDLKAAFEHFDKDGSGALNQLEFVASMTSMDFEGDLEGEFSKFADGETTNAESGEPEKTISFDAFVSLMLKQFKDNDTVDGLLGAFRTLANGKDILSAEDLEKHFSPTDAAFLQAQFTQADGGYDYMAFSGSVYGSA